MALAKRVVVLGLDALVPNTTLKLLEEGEMPNLRRLLERGSITRVVPVIPAQTPANWHTIATGATPGGHGVTVWGRHNPGDRVTQSHRAEAFNAGLCRAEYLWETAERAGLRSVVMNYAGYPPTGDTTTFIEWLYQPARSYFDLAPAAVYHNLPDVDTTDPIALRPARGWKNLPSAGPPPLEAEIDVAPSEEGRGPAYCLAVVGAGEAYDTVIVAKRRDAAAAVATLSAGQWSGWIAGTFRAASGARTRGAFRVKLVELSGDAGRLRLFRLPVFPTDGRHCSKPALGRRLVRELGPYVHSAMCINAHSRGLIDTATMEEIMGWEAQWWSGAAARAMASTRARLLYLHWHNLDAMGHDFVQHIDPKGARYDAAAAPRYWELVRAYYRAADRFVGAFVEKLDDGHTTFCVVSDHGMPANRKAVSLVNLFRRNGWLALAGEGKRIDWGRSAVFPDQNHIWINLKGRQRDGVVEPDAYRALRDAVIRSMRDLKDPETGDHVFAFVLARDEAPVVGLWGDHIGDIVCCYAGGYRWSGPEVLPLGEDRLVFPCGGGNHGPMIPTYETEVTSVLGTLILAGAGIKAGVALGKADQMRFWTKDVAPTLACLLGIDVPAQSEGRVLQEFVQGMPSDPPARRLIPTARRIVPRPHVKPRPVRLQGDVTDEGE